MYKNWYQSIHHQFNKHCANYRSTFQFDLVPLSELACSIRNRQKQIQKNEIPWIFPLKNEKARWRRPARSTFVRRRDPKYSGKFCKNSACRLRCRDFLEPLHYVANHVWDFEKSASGRPRLRETVFGVVRSLRILFPPFTTPLFLFPSNPHDRRDSLFSFFQPLSAFPRPFLYPPPLLTIHR